MATTRKIQVVLRRRELNGHTDVETATIPASEAAAWAKRLNGHFYLAVQESSEWTGFCDGDDEREQLDREAFGEAMSVVEVS